MNNCESRNIQMHLFFILWPSTELISKFPQGQKLISQKGLSIFGLLASAAEAYGFTLVSACVRTFVTLYI